MSDFQDAYEAGAARTRATLPTNVLTPLTVLVDGQKERVTSLERHAAQPTSKRGTVKVYDEASFCAYVNQHKGEGTQIFANERLRTCVAILDHHGAAPGWARHRVELVTQLSQEWVDWTDRDGKKTHQVEFAEFVEDHMPRSPNRRAARYST